VLVVDDEEPVRIVLGAVLARHGLSPVLAAGGDEALRQLTGGGDFRLVLLDLTMPGLSGEQTLQAMRRTHPQLRVILMSGFSERETRERCQALGAADFVAKPFDIQVLLGKMRRALG
jgi:CheY-like chemotaxis protein